MMVSRPLVMSPYQTFKSFKLSKMRVKDKNASYQLASWARTKAISTINLNSFFVLKKIVLGKQTQISFT
jgi:hypothetical protein